MLRAKFQDHRTSDSGEGDFKVFFVMYGHGGQFDHVTWTIDINFRSLFPRGLHMAFGI